MTEEIMHNLIDIKTGKPIVVEVSEEGRAGFEAAGRAGREFALRCKAAMESKNSFDESRKQVIKSAKQIDW